jgi:hypothetical protein
MLSSPQEITVNTVAIDCHKVSDDKTSSNYSSADGTLEFKVSHQINTDRSRRMVRLDQTVIAADPLTAVNFSQKAGVYLVIDEPRFGFENADIEYIVDALKLWLTSANILALLSSRH